MGLILLVVICVMRDSKIFTLLTSNAKKAFIKMFRAGTFFDSFISAGFPDSFYILNIL
jgi:hypothetical protein